VFACSYIGIFYFVPPAGLFDYFSCIGFYDGSIFTIILLFFVYLERFLIGLFIFILVILMRYTCIFMFLIIYLLPNLLKLFL
jgi:hypothetical protein